MANIIKQIKTAKELADILNDVLVLDEDKDGVADLKEHAGTVQRVAPHIVSLQQNVAAAQRDVDAIKAELGAAFDLLMKDLEVVQARINKALS